MIDLKERPDVGWNALFGVSIVIALAGVWYGYLRGPSTPTLPAASAQTVSPDKRVHQLDAESATWVADIQEKGWNTELEVLGSKVLEIVTGVAEKNKINLTGFRTEKPITVAHMKEAPFVAIVEGPFGSVREFLRTLEGPSSKLAVNLMQVSASDIGPGHVTATFGLVAFLPEDVH